jgi:type II secretory pathway pseudopilin PulG
MKSRASAPRCRGESGYTLSEVLVALFLLVTIVAAIVTAMGTSIIASDVHRKTVTADSVIRTYAERLQSTGYIPCATTGTPSYKPGSMFNNNQYPGFQAGTGMVSVTYWRGDTPATFDTSCTADKGIQLITIRAVSSDGRGNQTMDVIKRALS